MSKVLLAAVVLTVASTGACLFTDVGENLEQTNCVGEPKSFCDELNQLSPTGDPCLEWACDPGARACKMLPFDGDDDGAPLAMCAPAGVAPDCDDTDPRRRPKVGDSFAVELCDGVDNDCDDLVDEGAYQITVAPDPTVSGSVRDLAVLSVPGEENAQLLYGRGPGGVSDAYSSFSSEIAVTDKNVNVSRQSSAFQFSNVGGDLSLLAAFGTDGARDLLIGGLEAGAAGDGKLDAPSPVLHSAATAGYEVLSLGMASSGGAFVGSYADSAAFGETCGEIGNTPGATRQVRLFAGAIVSGEIEMQASDTNLITTADPSASPVIGTSDSTWLVAVAGVDAVEVHHVELSGESLQTTMAVNMSGLAGIPGDVDMAMNGDGSQLGVVFRDGCGNSTISLALIPRTSNGASGLGTPAFFELADAVNAQKPHILWRESPSPGWLVSWQESTLAENSDGKIVFTAHGRLAWISIAGEVIGDVYTLLDEPQFSQGFHLTHAAGNDFAAYAPSDNGTPGVRHIQISCLSGE